MSFILNEFIKIVSTKAYRQMKERVYIRVGKWLDVTFLQMTSQNKRATAGSNALTRGSAGFDLKGTEFTIFEEVNWTMLLAKKEN